ncbi:connector enhancer of kinase suppressor of ras 1 isoform X2 [Monodelphis domestica]|uniref:connector enhancer of kinase suppressor of ras 1 isoform X2 n=1 Tax=Monodelphis domestica TaxID=13616 RepID=UPI0024E242F4|nr:connector enhancer of kinase suppressor of ras 1 isoform X2 [Monodelphis domestica]
MEPVASWGPGSVVAWLRGLDVPVQEYPFEEWALVGNDLLQLCPRSLKDLGVWHIGHQELILDGVEQLRTLSSGLETENLRKLTEQLRALTHKLCSLVPGCLGANGEPAPELLTGAIELVRAAWALLCWLNRYLFSQINDFSACQEIGDLCRELARALQEDYPVEKKEAEILKLSNNISIICDAILNFSPDHLLDQLAILELVELRARCPEEALGLEILTTSSCHHFVSGTTPESPADSCAQILLGDEIVQVNGQVVVGWPRASLNRQLLQDPALLRLVLKTVPVPKSAPQSPSDNSCLRNQSPDLASPSPRTSEEKATAFIFDQCPDPRSPTSPEAGPTTPLSFGNIWGSDEPPSSPTVADPRPAAQPASEETENQGSPEPPDKSPSCSRKKSKSKGVATRLSRRRVSCRELGRPECDGWLLLRKVPGGFMGPRWRRCWMVLKGHTLYWYRQPQDEKAEGLVNVSNYSLESGRDQKKKYVFQLTHDMYKPFIFAADTLADLSMWVSHLVTCISKYQSHSRTPAPREEDCYSETEAEDPDEETGSRSASPNPGAWGSPHGDSSPSATTPQGSPRVSYSPSTASDSSNDGTLEHLVRGLQQGGVSFLGRPHLTQEQCRRSFLRRARDPQLNERAHHVRCLQSTLKAKLQELQALDEVLNDPTLTSEKFQRWKEKNQELLSDRPGAWAGLGAEGASCLRTPKPEDGTSFEPKEHLPPDPPCPKPPDL